MIYDVDVVEGCEELLRDATHLPVQIFGEEYTMNEMSELVQAEISARLSTPNDANEGPQKWLGCWIRVTKTTEKRVLKGKTDAIHTLEIWCFHIGQEEHPDYNTSLPQAAKLVKRLSRQVQLVIEAGLRTKVPSVTHIIRTPNANRVPIQPDKKAPSARLIVDTYNVTQRVFSAFGGGC